jgi:hypothetical protein
MFTYLFGLLYKIPHANLSKTFYNKENTLKLILFGAVCKLNTSHDDDNESIGDINENTTLIMLITSL